MAFISSKQVAKEKEKTTLEMVFILASQITKEKKRSQSYMESSICIVIISTNISCIRLVGLGYRKDFVIRCMRVSISNFSQSLIMYAIAKEQSAYKHLIFIENIPVHVWNGKATQLATATSLDIFITDSSSEQVLSFCCRSPSLTKWK